MKQPATLTAWLVHREPSGDLKAASVFVGIERRVAGAARDVVVAPPDLATATRTAALPHRKHEIAGDAALAGCTARDDPTKPLNIRRVALAIGLGPVAI